MSKKVYLAGPDVFRAKDLYDYFKNLKLLLTDVGLEGLSPFDTKANTEWADSIYKHNVKLIDECDGVLANLVPFRGPSLDPGTAFEIGYAIAKGKPVIGYNKPATFYSERAKGCETFPVVENFMRHENLMIACSVPAFETAEQAVRRIAYILNGAVWELVSATQSKYELPAEEDVKRLSKGSST